MDVSRNFDRVVRKFGRIMLRLKNALIRHGLLHHPLIPGPVQGLKWLRAHESPSGGILLYSRAASADQRVTGALLPTLLRYGERDMATRCAYWLIGIQQSDGAYSAAEDTSRIFSTGEVLRGLLASHELVPEALKAACGAADYLCGRLDEVQKTGGANAHLRHSIATKLPLSVVATLYEATALPKGANYRRRAENWFSEYRSSYGLPLDAPIHVLSHEVEALIRLGEIDLARSYCDQLRARQVEDGSVPAMPGVSWISSSGLAQLALCWHRLGQWEPATKALAWLERHQRRSGGFLGSYGLNAPYFPQVELAWTTKWYLDAHRLHVRSFMERYALPSDISLQDGRVQAVLRRIHPKDRVIEVGCGKGRFLKAIRETYTDVHCTGVDIAPGLFAELPAEIQALEGSLECVPCPDQSFDVAFSVEALEHSPNVEAAIRELVRITRPGGWIVIIDKQRSHWGQLETPSWEQWPDAKALAKLLGRYCDRVTFEEVGFDGDPPDGLMVVWYGHKWF